MSIPSQGDWGEILYVMFITKFQNVFAPKWNSLDDLSKQQWRELANQFDKLKNF
jgi:hypothetical protein